MVVLDTGSTDETMELARQAGASVYEMPWPGSFAEARNRSLELADADWNLIIDADEWIASGGANLRSWCQSRDRLGAICVRSLCEAPQEKNGENAPTYQKNWLTRVLPRGVRFERRVHEQPVSRLPQSRIQLYVDHDGYLRSQVEKKRDRNQSLLIQDLEDRPGDPYILYQLGLEAAKRKEFTTACKLLEEASALTPENASWAHGLTTRYLSCLAQAGDLDKALVYANQNFQRWEHSPDFFFMIGNIAFAKAAADPSNGLSEWLPLAIQMWETCLEIGDQPNLENSWHGVGSHLAQSNLNALRSKFPALMG